jgi:hypothetical protein
MIGMIRSTFHSLLQRARMTKPRKTVQVDFYTRKGCCLCDDAFKLVDESRNRYAIELRMVDVDGNEELVRKHGNCVPVVVVNGRVRFRGRVNSVLLERLLRAESTQG